MHTSALVYRLSYSECCTGPVPVVLLPCCRSACLLALDDAAGLDSDAMMFCNPGLSMLVSLDVAAGCSSLRQCICGASSHTTAGATNLVSNSHKPNLQQQ